jgi:hypothetical protein
MIAFVHISEHFLVGLFDLPVPKGKSTHAEVRLHIRIFDLGQ